MHMDGTLGTNSSICFAATDRKPISWLIADIKELIPGVKGAPSSCRPGREARNGRGVCLEGPAPQGGKATDTDEETLIVRPKGTPWRLRGAWGKALPA